ncbi:MAG: flagellar assembly protein FliH [Bacillaceae bacterium]|nr:flagellar assembly protein FliH [Bacillaceae bacterium]
MSKIIKSSYTRPEPIGTKTISVKKIKPLGLNEESLTTEVEEEIHTQVEEQAKLLLEQSQYQAEQLIQEAENNAKAIREQLEQEQQYVYNELEQLKQEAKQQGYDDGYQQGLEAGRLQYEEALVQAANIIQASKNDYAEVIEQAQPTIIELAFTISEKLIGTTFDQNSEAWTKLVQKAILEVREQDEVKVYVHPDWYERTLQHKNELITLLSHSEKLYIYPDPQLREHGCIIETPFGRIDASVDSQLTELKHVLLEKLKEGKHGSS